MAALSWFLFSWLYNSGELDREDDRRAIKARVKKMKKFYEKEKRQKRNYFYDKWMWFGSGFYGLAGLWTFAVIEITDLFSFVYNFSASTQLFDEGLMNFLVTLGLNQLGNILNAFLWFAYWPADSVLLWVLVAYIGYWVGVEIARSNQGFPSEGWLGKLTKLMAGKNPSKNSSENSE